jgi:hypothetical protein
MSSGTGSGLVPIFPMALATDAICPLTSQTRLNLLRDDERRIAIRAPGSGVAGDGRSGSSKWHLLRMPIGSRLFQHQRKGSGR